MTACRTVYGSCIKQLLRNLSVIEFGQFDREILYKDYSQNTKLYT